MNIEERANIYVGQPTSMGEDINVVIKRSSYIKGSLDQLVCDIEVIKNFLSGKIDNEVIVDLEQLLNKNKHS